MQTIEYHLYRVKFVRPLQVSIFHDNNLTSQEMMLLSIHSKPSAEVKRGNQWHIGNVKLFSKTSGYFAVGRTTLSTIEKFDLDSGNFVEEELEKSPYTHCVFNAAIGLIGIAKKLSLAQTTQGIANRLEQLLESTEVVRKNAVKVEVLPISDPEGFLKAIQSAYRVLSYTASFRGPNPFDADEYFQRPLAVYLSAADGTRGKTSISGEDLNREVLHEVTRSTAATGNEASAKIQRTQDERPITVNLKGDPLVRKYDEDEHQPEKALEDLVLAYEGVRHDGHN